MAVIRAEAIQYANQVFEGLSGERLRACGLAAARDCARLDGRPGTPYVELWSWVRTLLLSVTDLPIEGGPAGALTINEMLDALSRGPHLLHGQRTSASDYAIRRFWHWMVRVNFAVEIVRDHWAITDAGVRRLHDDDPLRPGALQRLRESCIGLGLDDSLNRVDDAQSCLDAGLGRPAVVLLGLAYEEMIAVVLARLTGKTVEELKSRALDRQGELRKELNNHRQGEAREGALLALNAADTIRRARNGASHDATGEWDLREAERLLASGVDAYPKLAQYKAAP